MEHKLCPGSLSSFNKYFEQPFKQGGLLEAEAPPAHEARRLCAYVEQTLEMAEANGLQSREGHAAPNGLNSSRQESPVVVAPLPLHTSFIEHCCVLGTAPGTSDTALSRADTDPCLRVPEACHSLSSPQGLCMCWSLACTTPLMTFSLSCLHLFLPISWPLRGHLICS